ncbi:unnamed protein product [Bursaphelenchus okinawaensis]|uniref:PDZ domain-containing protein n=1 Tax=Bursaphelenchus okinawaensis TaxID=465554 RepID=A0A811KCF8_9BILA|nr:unnamed protein product [Bursaphelenchus okinawaensis]CAG9098648.1 unnamed protein product [Bursaphelenchus okinawaensis]
MCDSTLETTGFTDGPPTLFPAELEAGFEEEEKPKPKETTIYYYWEQDPSLFRTTIPVAPHKLTLAHLKCALNMTNIKCFMMKMDPNVKHKVKMDIQDEDQILEPDEDGNFIFYFMKFDEDLQGGTLRRSKYKKQAPKPVMVHPKKPAQIIRPPQPKQYQNPEVISDDSSSYDDDSGDITSISRISERRRTRRPRNRRAWSPSFMSTTMETDVSVSVNLYTVSLNPIPEVPFGLNVVVRENGKQQTLTVGSLAPGSCVALDGRILPGHIIIEVNKEPLADYTAKQGLKILTDAVDRATRTRGQVQLTLASPMELPTYFQPPDESIHPIDTAAWVQCTNRAIGLDTENQHYRDFTESYSQGFKGYGRGFEFGKGEYGKNDADFGKHGADFAKNGADFMKNGPEFSRHQNSESKFYSIENMDFKQPTGTWPSSGVGSSIVSSNPERYGLETPATVIVQAMLDPRHGVPKTNDNQHLLNINNGFLGQHIINWLSDNVNGLDDSETCARYAENLINNKFLVPITTSKSFSRHGFYTVNFDLLPRNGHNTLRRGVLQEIKPAMDDTIMDRKGKGCFFFCMKKNKRK